MPQGLQIWDANGKQILDTNQQTSSIIGVLTISSTGTKTVTDSRFAWGKPFVFVDTITAGVEIKSKFVGNQLTLAVTSNTGGLSDFEQVKIYYGVF